MELKYIYFEDENQLVYSPHISQNMTQNYLFVEGHGHQSQMPQT